MGNSTAEARASALSCWRGPVAPEPISGGITNANFVVQDGGVKYFVRIGDDIPEHGVMRFNELAASRAAHAAGVSPAVVHAEPGALVLAYIEGDTLTPEAVREDAILERILRLVQICHRTIPQHLRGAALVFWVFQAVRNYAKTLAEDNSRMVPELPRYLDIAAQLEQAIGNISLVFGHNDLLAANFIDDGERLWLVDWDYAGFNSPLFDLGGLATNNELSEQQQQWVLESYFSASPDADLQRRYSAMKCASLLRESMWSMVSELYSTIDFDYIAYTTENLGRFEAAWR
ncbi:MAG: choline kinase family protein, partial [Gammaproteobacteria bacterium]|nr:choline kinase family protein [Gammaproteobacteria bacterium]